MRSLQRPVRPGSVCLRVSRPVIAGYTFGVPEAPGISLHGFRSEDGGIIAGLARPSIYFILFCRSHTKYRKMQQLPDVPALSRGSPAKKRGLIDQRIVLREDLNRSINSTALRAVLYHQSKRFQCLLQPNSALHWTASVPLQPKMVFQLSSIQFHR